MGMTEFKAIIGMWVLTQVFIVPWIAISEYKKDALAVDLGALVLLIIMYFGFKLIGV